MMKLIHSWSGLLFGWLLFAVCLTGTLTIFDNEITYWMQSELLEVSANQPEFHETALPLTESKVWGRIPLLALVYTKQRDV